jgi:hypothetical protein
VQIDIGKQNMVWILKHKEHDRVAAGNALNRPLSEVQCIFSLIIINDLTY